MIHMVCLFLAFSTIQLVNWGIQQQLWNIVHPTIHLNGSKLFRRTKDMDTEGFLEECFGQKHKRVAYMHERLMDTPGGKHLFQSDVPLLLQASAKITRK